MTNQEFIELCKNHDYYYMMSDDHRYYCSGRKEALLIASFKEIYPDEYKKFYLNAH